VNGVDVTLLDEPQEVWELFRDGALRLQEPARLFDKVVGVRHVRENIVADDEVGCVAVVEQPLGDPLPEEVGGRAVPARG
jgi:hypothetical protein